MTRRSSRMNNKTAIPPCASVAMARRWGSTSPCDSAAATAERDANQTLIEAIAKAHRWQEPLESGEYPSLEDIAQAVGVDRTYVGRMLRLTSLALDIVEAILRGSEPEGMTLEPGTVPNGTAVCREAVTG